MAMNRNPVVDSDQSSESETVMTSSGGTEQKQMRKMKKLRSIKLSRFPSLKSSSSARKAKPQSNSGSSSYQSTPTFSRSDSSPHYMNPTNSSDTRKRDFKTLPTTISTSNSKKMKIFSRMSSRRIKNKTNKSSSSASKTESLEDEDVKSKLESSSTGVRAGVILSRKNSLKPMRKLAKMATFKSKKYSSIEKHLGIQKATCSSALKDWKFPDPGESESERIEVVKKVCPYSYCSLHGHKHANAPPLKRFVSMRRRAVKPQQKKNKKSERSEVSGAVEKVSREITSGEEAGSTNLKYVRMWHLMDKDAMKGNTEKSSNELCVNERVEKGEEPVEEAKNLLGNDHDCAFEDPISDEGKVELCIDAINLVQKAFDEILLVPERSRGEGEEDSSSISRDSPNEADSTLLVEEKKGPARWSNLKKLILLRRFVKALEKVRKINPRKPRYLPMEQEPEGDKVNLRRQMVEGRKNTEQWMLDFALRQVVSKLGPAQKKRVEMLVEAFETVLPISGVETTTGSKEEASTANLIHGHSGLYAISEENESENTDHSFLKEISKKCNDSVDVSSLDTRNPDLDDKSLLNPDYNSGRDYQEVPVNGKVLKVSKEIISRLSHKLQDGEASGSTVKSFDSDPLISETIEHGPSQGNHEKGTAAIDDTHIGGNLGLWRVIYKHMVSSIAAKDETEPLADVAENEKVDCNAEDENVEPHLIEATKLMQDAIDEIILPEDSDSSDQDPELIKESQEGSIESEKTRAGAVDIGIEQSKPMQNNRWGNLKKLILLQRFIKAAEKVKKFNMRGPRFLPILNDPEAEKVHLRRQEREDRKKAEEWMLDYAVQQAVAKLTPARKRRVELLVEAFETVGPSFRN